MVGPAIGLVLVAIDPQRTSEGGPAGEPDGRPPIGDMDALTEVPPSR